MDEDLYHKLLPVFIAEAARKLDDIDTAILDLQRVPGDAGALANLGRAAHTIKGNAAALGMRGMVVEAQRIEWWAMDAPPSLSRVAVATLNNARGELRRLLDEVTADAEALQ